MAIFSFCSLIPTYFTLMFTSWPLQVSGILWNHGQMYIPPPTQEQEKDRSTGKQLRSATRGPRRHKEPFRWDIHWPWKSTSIKSITILNTRPAVSQGCLIGRSPPLSVCLSEYWGGLACGLREGELKPSQKETSVQLWVQCQRTPSRWGGEFVSPLLCWILPPSSDREAPDTERKGNWQQWVPPLHCRLQGAGREGDIVLPSA